MSLTRPGWTGTPRAAAWVALGIGAAGAPTDSDLGFRVQDFDWLLGALQAALAKDPGTGFVFSCLSGQGRTTTAMVVAVLAFWHIRVCDDRGLPRQGASWSLGTPAKAGGSGGLSWCLVWSQRPLPLALGRRRVGWQTPQHGLWAWVWGRVQSGSWAPSPSGCLLSGLP